MLSSGLRLSCCRRFEWDFPGKWKVSTRYVVIVRPLRVVVVDDFGILCGKFPCTIFKTQVLVLSCSSEFPHTFVRFCISLPHLRTRRGVILIWTSSGKFPCTFFYEIRTLSVCSENLRATCCTQTRRCRRACRSLRDQVQRRLRLCHNSPFSYSLLHSFRHRFGQLAELKILILKRWRRLFHSSRVKLPFVCMSEGFGVNIFDLDFLDQVDSVKKPINRNSVGSGCVTHCWTSALDDDLDQRFIVLTLRNSKSLCWIWVIVWELVCRAAGVPAHSLWILWLVGRRMQHFNNQIPKIKSGNSVHAQTCIKRNNFWFRWTVWDRSLLLAHPTYWNTCMTSKNAQCSSWRRFWIFKISRKIRVLKQSQLTLWTVFPTWQYCLNSHVWWM